MVRFGNYYISYSPKKDRLSTGHPLLEYIKNQVFKRNQNFLALTTGMVGCLDEDTKIKVVENDRVVYKTLKQLENTEFTVLSYDFENKKIVQNPAQITESGQQEVYKITFQDGTTINATLEHRFFLPEGREITTQDLLNIYSKKVNPEKPNKDYRICLASRHRKFRNENPFWEQTHTDEFKALAHEREFITGVRAYHRPFMLSQLPNFCEVCSATKKRLLVHHKDLDRKNNSLDNLQRVCFSCHSQLHNHGFLSHPYVKRKNILETSRYTGLRRLIQWLENESVA
jgi:hypothetical protein